MQPGISLRVTDCAGANGFQWEIEGIKDLCSSHVSFLVVFEISECALVRWATTASKDRAAFI